MATALFVDTETPGFKKPLKPIQTAYKILSGKDPRRLLVAGESNYQLHFVPAEEFEFGAMAVHNILPEDVAGARPFQAAQWAINLDGIDYMVGHNVDFDWEVLGKPDVRRICTLAMSRYWWPDLDAHRLGAMMYFLLGATREVRDGLKEAHDARTDVDNCVRIFDHMVMSKEVDSWTRLYGISELGRIPHRMTFGKYGPKNGNKGMLISEMVTRDPGYVKWLKNNVDDLDPYLLKALNNPRKIQ